MKKNKGKTKMSKHDKEVLRIAKLYERNGWQVKADLPNYPKPDPIGWKKRRPDIQATKRGATRLIEVETPKSMITDKNQRRTFQRYAKNRSRTTFTTVSINSEKKRKRKRNAK